MEETIMSLFLGDFSQIVLKDILISAKLNLIKHEIN